MAILVIERSRVFTGIDPQRHHMPLSHEPVALADLGHVPSLPRSFLLTESQGRCGRSSYCPKPLAAYRPLQDTMSLLLRYECHPPPYLSLGNCSPTLSYDQQLILLLCHRTSIHIQQQVSFNASQPSPSWLNFHTRFPTAATDLTVQHAPVVFATWPLLPAELYKEVRS